MMAKRTSTPPLRRPVDGRPEKRVLRIFCEGARTEPEYFEAVKRLPTVHSSVSVKVRSDPRAGRREQLLDKAITARRTTLADEVWCVFDVESHVAARAPVEKLRLLQERAGEGGVAIAFSNPCFEVWLVLHHGEQHARLTTDDAVRLRRVFDGSIGKEVAGAKYMGTLQLAADRATQLDRRHEVDGTIFPENNPSSGVYRLLGSLGAVVLASVAR
jgi:hypothetical protein